MMKKLLTIVVTLTCGLVAGAQNLTPDQYIEQYKDLAISEMKRMGVPAAITLAQGLLETESGNSDLLRRSNNHFGIKCKSNWSGNGVSHDDDALGECFRTYKNAEESYRDHSNFLRGNDRYAFLFRLDPADYKAWAYGLKKAGYATNPKYPAVLIKNIEQYNLQQYSDMALGEVPKFESDKYENDKEVPFVYVEDSATTGIADPEKNDEAAVNSINESTVSVNNVKCMYARKGTSLLAIATKYDVQLNKLLQYNDLEQDGLLEKDQLIFLGKKSDKGLTEYHIVKEGERLQDVAQKNGIQLQYLLEYNNLDKYAVLQPGTKLYLQHERALNLNTAKQDAVPAIKYHTVQPKEGLYTISKKFGVTVQQIKEWNNLTSNNLSVGQQLIVAR